MSTKTAACPALGRLREAVLSMVRADKQADLTARQLAILLLVDTVDGPRTVRGLAAALKVQKPVVTRAADRLAGLGLAERREDPADRRSVLIAATHDGRMLGRQLARAMAVRPGSAA